MQAKSIAKLIAQLRIGDASAQVDRRFKGSMLYYRTKADNDDPDNCHMYKTCNKAVKASFFRRRKLRSYIYTYAISRV